VPKVRTILKELGAAALLAVLLLIWARSALRTDFAGLRRGCTGWQVVSMQGNLYFQWAYVRYSERTDRRFDCWTDPANHYTFKQYGGSVWSKVGLLSVETDVPWDRYVDPTGTVETWFYGFASADCRTLILPYWLIAVPLGAVTILWWARLSRRAWREHVGRVRCAHGLCAACGYDLRGTPDRCPECGSVPAGVTRS